MSFYTANDINPYILSCGYLNESNCPPHGTVYAERVVKWYEIELITWGQGYILTEGNKINTMQGDVFFRTPGMKVQGFSPYYCYLIVFDPLYNPDTIGYSDQSILDAARTPENSLKYRTNFLGHISVLNFPYVMKTLRYNELFNLFSCSYNEFMYQKSDIQFYLKTYLFQILELMIEERLSANFLQNANRSIRLNYSKVQESKKYIDRNLSRSFKLNELAEVAGLSPNFFCRVFRDIVGETPISYINRNKVNYAKRLLVETQKKIKEIAYDCGFDNDTYFHTLFKEVVGLTPSEFRENYKVVT